MEVTLCCSAGAFHCDGFSCCGAQALAVWASVVVARGLSALLLRGMWDFPGPGLQHVSPALAGGFLTTAPPGKSLSLSSEGSAQEAQRTSHWSPITLLLRPLPPVLFTVSLSPYNSFTQGDPFSSLNIGGIGMEMHLPLF